MILEQLISKRLFHFKLSFGFSNKTMLVSKGNYDMSKEMGSLLLFGNFRLIN